MSDYDTWDERALFDDPEYSGTSFECYEGFIQAETSMAILFRYEDKEYWLPKSQIKFPKDYIMNTENIVEIPNWLAIEKEII